jgi:hypothetical protein
VSGPKESASRDKLGCKAPSASVTGGRAGSGCCPVGLASKLELDACHVPVDGLVAFAACCLPWAAAMLAGIKGGALWSAGNLNGLDPDGNLLSIVCFGDCCGMLAVPAG